MAPVDQRFGKAQEQIVDIVPLLGPHLEDVAKSGRGDEPDARAAALDDRIGHQRGAMHDSGHETRSDPRPGEREPCAHHRGIRGIARCRQLLRHRDDTMWARNDDVGEGATDVDAKGQGAGHRR